VPDPGESPCKWLPLFKRIQAAGKAIHISIASSDIDEFMAGLRPEGVMMCTSAGSVEEADAIVEKVKRWR
jgi:hypothetical protein